MSAEPALLILLSNIKNESYIYDAYSEIEKCLSHNNLPFIIANANDKHKFFKINDKNIIFIPYIQKQLGILYYLKIFEKLYL